MQQRISKIHPNHVPVQRTCRQVAELECVALAPFSFERTVRRQTRYGADWFWQTPTEQFCEGILYSAIRLNDNTPVGLALQAAGTETNPSVLVSLFSDIDLSDEQIRFVHQQLIKGLDLHVDLSSFYSVIAKYPLLQIAVEDLRGMRAAPLLDLFSRVVLAILLQATSSGRTDRMLSALCTSFGEHLLFNGRDICLIPEPSVVAGIPEEILRHACKVGYRGKFLIGCAEALLAGGIPSLGALESLPANQAHKALLQLPGIGEYAAEIVTPHPSFPVDIWSVQLFRRVFEITADDNPRDVIRAVRRRAKEEFGEWQHYAYAYLIEDWDRLSSVIGQ